MNEYLKRAWAEIYTDRMTDNLSMLRGLIDENKTDIMCVVKANAYGHDDDSIAAFLEKEGIKYFAVSNLNEAQRLRKTGIQGEILILGHTPCEYAKELAADNIIQTAVCEEHARELSEAAVKYGVSVRIHLAADTGMGRIGICINDDESVNEAAAAAVRISQLDGISLEGIFTHYACADSENPDDEEYTAMQTDRFFSLCDKVKQSGVKLIHTHCLNSAGGAFHYDDRSTLVRFGIMLYGLKPDISLEMPVPIKPVMELKAAIGYVKKIRAGSFVSYGRTFKADKDMITATVPIGYADGYPRALSSKAYVLVRGRKAPIIGRICMDQLMIDVTDIEGVKEGDTATLMGTDGEYTVTADDLAVISNTIGYEIVCGISGRIPRVIYHGGKITGTAQYF